MKKTSGFYVDPNWPNQLADKIVFLKNNRVLKEEMGKMSRKLAEEKYDKNILCAKFANVIKKLKMYKTSLKLYLTLHLH